jgi:hypothetical protein
MEGFRQIFQAAGNLFSFKAEVHVNKEIEVKTEVKTPVGTVENKTTTTVVENKIEISTNFGDYFKNGGGNLFDISAGSTVMSKVENTTTSTIKTNGAPIKVATKTSTDENGTSNTTSIGTGASIDLGDKTKVNFSANGFMKQQLSGKNAGEISYGFKTSVDATFVSKLEPIVTTPNLKITNSTQTTVGGSVTQQYKFLAPW